MLSFQIQEKAGHSGCLMKWGLGKGKHSMKKGDISKQVLFRHQSLNLVSLFFSFFGSLLRKGLFYVLSHQSILILIFSQQKRILNRRFFKKKQKQYFTKVELHPHKTLRTFAQDLLSALMITPRFPFQGVKGLSVKASPPAGAHSNLKPGSLGVSLISRMLRCSDEARSVL